MLLEFDIFSSYFSGPATPACSGKSDKRFTWHWQSLQGRIFSTNNLGLTQQPNEQGCRLTSQRKSDLPEGESSLWSSGESETNLVTLRETGSQRWHEENSTNQCDDRSMRETQAMLADLEIILKKRSWSRLSRAGSSKIRKERVSRKAHPFYLLRLNKKAEIFSISAFLFKKIRV